MMPTKRWRLWHAPRRRNFLRRWVSPRRDVSSYLSLCPPTDFTLTSLCGIPFSRKAVLKSGTCLYRDENTCIRRRRTPVHGSGLPYNTFTRICRAHLMRVKQPRQEFGSPQLLQSAKSFVFLHPNLADPEPNEPICAPFAHNRTV